MKIFARFMTCFRNW